MTIGKCIQLQSTHKSKDENSRFPQFIETCLMMKLSFCRSQTFRFKQLPWIVRVLMVIFWF